MPYTALLSALSSLPLDGYNSDQREALGTLYEYIEDPSPALCLQMNRQDLLGVFIGIFVQKLTELGGIMQ